jgi:CubicO group peptidase (beta-lactamase class C family)
MPRAAVDRARLERITSHFARYVDDGRLPGWHIVVTRDGETVYDQVYGQRDLEAAAPVEPDTLWRIYSMTKPVTSVAAMSLFEEGAFELKDPISRWLPAFADTRVFTGGSDLKPVTEPQTEPIRVWHLLTHTAGLTYGFHHAHPVDAIYRARGYEWSTPPGKDLAACCDDWAGMPLLFQPGDEWNYSVATDVLGRVLEVIAGKPLDAVLRERVLDPLGMTETGFSAPAADHDRLAALYIPDPATGKAVRHDALGTAALSPPDALSGGGGLVSTAADFGRFATMLLAGGELDGTRILGPRTVEFMTENHLPGGADLQTFGRPLFAEVPFDGVGFGLGFGVVLDPVLTRSPSSPGDYSWGGAASTVFFVDPLERLTAMLFTQLLPSSTHPLRSQLRQLIHQALLD